MLKKIALLTIIAIALFSYFRTDAPRAVDENCIKNSEYTIVRMLNTCKGPNTSGVFVIPAEFSPGCRLQPRRDVAFLEDSSTFLGAGFSIPLPPPLAVDDVHHGKYAARITISDGRDNRACHDTNAIVMARYTDTSENRMYEPVVIHEKGNGRFFIERLRKKGGTSVGTNVFFKKDDIGNIRYIITCNKANNRCVSVGHIGFLDRLYGYRISMPYVDDPYVIVDQVEKLLGEWYRREGAQ